LELVSEKEGGTKEPVKETLSVESSKKRILSSIQG